jgi:hypothetical protein
VGVLLLRTQQVASLTSEIFNFVILIEQLHIITRRLVVLLSLSASISEQQTGTGVPSVTV